MKNREQISVEGMGRRRWVWLQNNMRSPCDDGIVLYLDHGGRYMNLHM